MRVNQEFNNEYSQVLSQEQILRIVETALMVAGRPLTIKNLQQLFSENTQPTNDDMRAILEIMRAQHTNNTLSGIELQEVASGFQFQAKTVLKDWLCNLWDERPQRYSRALLETLALIAYRQPITRAEIEAVRGVSVSSQTIKTLTEREWIRVIGYRDLPGKPALYGTTQEFLNHFNLKGLEHLPTLVDLLKYEQQHEQQTENLTALSVVEESVVAEIGV